MYLWDTNIVGYFASQHPTLRLHIQRIGKEQIFLPSPAVAEILRGRTEFAVKAPPEQVVSAHQQLRQTQFLIAQFNALLFGEDDALKKILKKHQSKKRYVDLMIAAMAFAGNHIVVTRNVKHFADVLPPPQI